MRFWLRLVGPALSTGALVRGSDRLDAAKWSNPGPAARPHRKVDRHAAASPARDGGARLSGTRWRVASVINIQPYATDVNAHPTSAETAAAAQIRSYLWRSRSHLAVAGQHLPEQVGSDLGGAVRLARSTG